MESSPVKILVPGNHLMAGLLGQQDELLRLIEKENPDAHISVRGNEITIGGDDAERIGRLFEEMIIVLEAGQTLDSAQVKRTIDMMHDDVRPSEVLTAELLKSSRGRAVRPKTAGQKAYADAIASNVVTFGIGPAGTGKSYLAVALAVQALQAHQVSRIILTRPAVEAGERLGFLPGDLMAKVDPYLRPLYDALHDLLEPEGAQRLFDRGTVEVAPLAFMRGRTLNSSFIILDEAQNTSPEQMKMFLTRIGFGSKAVITGDITQIDVPGGRSGTGRIGIGAVGHQGPRLRPPDPAGCRAPPHRGRHRRRLRARDGFCGPGGYELGSSMSVDIYAADEQADHPVAVDRWSELARMALMAEGITTDTEVSLLFVDEPSIAALNERFLGKSGPTDVLSFPIEDEVERSGRSPDQGGTGPGSVETDTDRFLLLGDVVICPAVAARNAVDHGASFDDELALLVVHGILHLLGMDHQVDAEAERMEQREQQLLARYYRVGS